MWPLAHRGTERPFQPAPLVVRLSILKVLIILALLVAGGSLLYGQLVEADADKVPVPSMVVVPDPPPIDARPPNPLR